MVGTIRELRWRKLGFNIRYTISQLDELVSPDAVFYTALTGLFSYHGSTEISIGFSRNYLSGGFDIGIPWKMEDAAQLILEDLFLIDKNYYYVQNLDAPDQGLWNWDPWDQVISGFVSISIPTVGANVYFEIATGDHRASRGDLLTQPDHNTVAMFGMRKYGFFDHNDLVFVFEYSRLIKSYSHNEGKGGDFTAIEVNIENEAKDIKIFIGMFFIINNLFNYYLGIALQRKPFWPRTP